MGCVQTGSKMGGIISRGCGFRSMQAQETPPESESQVDGESDRLTMSLVIRQPRSYLEKADGAGAWMSRHALMGFGKDHHSLSRDHFSGRSVSSSLLRSKSMGRLAGGTPGHEHSELARFLARELIHQESAPPETIRVGPHVISADPHRLLRYMNGHGMSKDDIRTSSSREVPAGIPAAELPGAGRWFVMRTLQGPMTKSETEKNRLFAERASRACLDVATKIQSGECRTLMDVWDAATAFRKTTTPDPSFALPRAVADISLDAGATTTSIYGGYNTLLLHDGRNGTVDASRREVTQRQEITIAGQTIPLTGLTFSAPYEFHEKTLHGMMQHTDPAHVPLLMEHCEQLMQQVLSDTATPTREDKLNRLGEMQWVMAQAMPDQRGSAFKSEFCTRALALAKDIVLPPYKGGIAPDLEAFACPKDEFVRRFSAVFDPARADESLFEQP